MPNIGTGICSGLVIRGGPLPGRRSAMGGPDGGGAARARPGHRAWERGSRRDSGRPKWVLKEW
eukprot:9132700-Pyramimonas_sp.AAC.1